MAEEKNNHNSPMDMSGISQSTDSPLLSSIFSSMGGGNSGMLGSGVSTNDSLDLLSILPSSNNNNNNNNGSVNTLGITPMPLDPDIDQLMKSLGDIKDAPKVTDDELNKLLGSINVSFSSSMPMGSNMSSVSDSDSLAALGRDLGIDLSSPVPMSTSTPLAAMGDGLSLSSFTPSMTHGASQGMFGMQHTPSMPGSPGMAGHMARSSPSVSQQVQFRPATPRPSPLLQRPMSNPQAARRPPPSQTPQPQTATTATSKSNLTAATA
ncbi:hypothetical protein GGF37_005838, partial [Kickxella alabastrina]